MPPLLRTALLASTCLAGLSVAAELPHVFGGETTGRPAGSERGFGIVEGTVAYRNDAKRTWRTARYYVKHPKTGELAEAVVALDGSALNGPALKRPGLNGARPAVSIVDQKEMRFVPETAAIRAGDRVRFTNSDPQTHNIASRDPRLSFSETITAGQQFLETFPKATGIRRPIALGCALHSQMQGWIYVFDHPSFQVTGVDGRFRLERVPPGEYCLDMAHSAGDLHARRVIHVKPDETTTVGFVLGPRDRSPED